jgi:hypothetical protein
MKRTCTLLIFICSFFLNASAQNFVSENNLWSIISKDGSGENMWKVTKNIQFMGDSILNETLYSKLFKSTDNGENWNFSSLWYEKNDSVFQYSTSEKVDLLTYNFNLHERDSFYAHTIDDYLYVDSASTQIWGNSERKIIYLGNTEYSDIQTIWIQGVGQDGYIIRSTELDICGAICNILCFHENGEQIYQNPDYSTCYINTKTSVSTLEDQAKLIEVFPCDISTLTIRMYSQQQGEFMLFDLEGRKILKQDINDTETQLCLPQSGIFIYRFTSNEGEIQTGKVMVN